MRDVDFATVVDHWSVPTPFADGGVPTGWQVAVKGGGAAKRIIAYVICAED